MEHILNPPLIGRGILILICYSFGRVSTWRSSEYTSRSFSSMGHIRFLIPSRARTKSLGGTLSFCCLYQGTQPMPSRVTDTCNSNGTQLERCPELSSMLLEFCLLKSSLLFQFPVLMCPFFPTWYKRGWHCVKWGIKVLPNSQISAKAHF